MDITITQDDLDEILSEFGFAVLDETDWPFKQKYVRKNFIWPAMRDFFRFHPIIEFQEVYIDTYFDVDFPDETTFGVVEANLNTNAIRTGLPVGEPFADSRSIMNSSYKYGGRYGTSNTYGQEVTFHSRRAEYNGLKNSQRSWRFNVDKQARKVTGYSNIQGRITIKWAKFTTDFDTIEFNKKRDVIDLCRANIFRGWGNMLSMQSTSLDNELNPDFMISRAEELETKVWDKWKAYTKPVILVSR